MWKNVNPCMRLVEMKIGTATTKQVWQFFQGITNKATMRARMHAQSLQSCPILGDPHGL